MTRYDRGPVRLVLWASAVVVLAGLVMLWVAP